MSPSKIIALTNRQWAGVDLETLEHRQRPLASSSAAVSYGLPSTGEFLLGNTFSMIVFLGYGAHFFTFATTFMPFYGALEFALGGDPYTPTPLFASSFGKRTNPFSCEIRN